MSDITIFRNSEFGDIGILVLDGKEYFPATECARILGYANPEKAIRDHCKGVNEMVTPSLGGIQKKRFIPEGDLFRLIVKSKLPDAERFERWVFDEVLPTIRKHGLYAKEELLENPDIFIAALLELKAEKEKAKRLQVENAQNKQIIAELQPKASYYDLILQNKTIVPISQISKDYGMSGRAFNVLLHELGVQYKMSGCWLLYQQHADKGYTQSKTHLIDAQRSVMHTYWTQKGRLFLYDLLKNECGLLPVIERNQKTA